jgi:hypothetical protein
MMCRRLASKLRAQDWTAISIEFVIVVIGVFIAMQVSNWNENRIERRETAKLLVELKPALQGFVDHFQAAEDYYRTTAHYADAAFAGWSGDPKVSDREFVVAAYQASQIYLLGLNGTNWAAIFGGGQLRNIDDPVIRRRLGGLMTTDLNVIEQSMFSKYREDVRQVIPEGIQDAIRARCNDREDPSRFRVRSLPPECDLDGASFDYASAARALRAHPELVGELRLHRATVATYLLNVGAVEQQSRELLQRMGADGD